MRKLSRLALVPCVAVLAIAGCGGGLSWQTVAQTAITADTALVTVAFTAIQAQAVATPDLCKPEDVAQATAAFSAFQTAATAAQAAVNAGDRNAATAAISQMAIHTATIMQIKARVCPFLNKDKPRSTT